MFAQTEQLSTMVLKRDATFAIEEHRMSPLLSLIKVANRMVKILDLPSAKKEEHKSGIEIFSKFLVPAGLSKLHPILKPRMLKRNKKVQQTIDHNDVNKNNALIAVTFENDAALAKVFRKIIKYNRTHDNILLVFFEKFVN